MMAKLKSYLDRIDDMSLRERVMIFFMLATIVVALMWHLFIDPLRLKQKQMNQHVSSTQAQVQALEAQMQALAESAKRDPDVANKQRLAGLLQQREQALGALAKVKQGLVNADQMAALLRDVLGRNSRLKLVEMKTLPAAALIEVTPAQTATKPDALHVQPDLGLYKHGVEISIEGNYADLLAYVTKLEQMPWRVYWHSLQLVTQTYPVSRMTLKVFTLSLDSTWLAV